jgi:hypothetical protein
MAHSAYPELGDSAVHKLVRALNAMLHVSLPVVDDVGPSTLNLGVIEGGRAPNVLADTASAQILVRLVGPSDATKAALESAISPHAAIDFQLEIPFTRLQSIEGMATMVAGFYTDIPSLTNWGDPLLIGPGSIHVAHSPAERIAKAELWQAVELYVAIAESLAAAEDFPRCTTGDPARVDTFPSTRAHRLNANAERCCLAYGGVLQGRGRGRVLIQRSLFHDHVEVFFMDYEIEVIERVAVHQK